MKVWGVVRDGEGWSGVFCSGEATGGRWVRPRERKKEKNGSTCMLIEKYENELSAEIGEVGGGRGRRGFYCSTCIFLCQFYPFTDRYGRPLCLHQSS